MGRKAVLAGLVVSFLLALPVGAQHAELDPLRVTPSGEAYLDATGRRGLDRDVLYFDPTRPPPPLETDADVPAEGLAEAMSAMDDTSNENADIIALVVSGLILVGLLVLIWISRGRFSVSFARDPATGAARRDPRDQGPEDTQVPVGLEAILAMADRRAALVALCKSLLARVMRDQGVLLNKSWTDRDTLRRVPPTYPLRDALRDLIHASERVQFGGRDVTEEEFRAHVTRLSPLWTGARG